MTAISETTLEIGLHPQLSAVMGLNSEAQSDLAVVILNAGLLHRVGPFRMHVDLARTLQPAFNVIRVDLSGLGYSDTRSDSGGQLADATADSTLLFDYLQAHHGFSRFVLIGLCSGAENAHHIALADARVAGCVFLDGFAFPTLRSRWIHYRVRLFRLGIWKDWIRSRLLPKKSDPDASPEGGLWEVELPEKEQFGQHLKVMLDRGSRLLFVYAGISGINNYPDQLKDAVPEARNDLCETRVIPSADHTYIMGCDREVLIDTISAWLNKSFPRL